MKITKYNKLVRDKIPEIIWQNGQQAVVEALSEQDYAQALDQKLGEELQEYRQSKNVEELADLLEVIYAMAQTHGVGREELENIRAQKAEERGGFTKRLLLKSVMAD